MVVVDLKSKETIGFKMRYKTSNIEYYDIQYVAERTICQGTINVSLFLLQKILLIIE